MELILGILFVLCFMIGAVQVFAFLLGAFAITAGWFVLILFGFVGVILPFFLFTTLFAYSPILTGILVICFAVWIIMFILKKGFQGLKICFQEIKRYFDERDYKKYK